jgi:uncharacterized repeat protein (TIGR03803 family)
LGLAIAALAPGQPHAANLVPLVSFNGADGANPLAGLIADANGNLFGTTALGGASGDGTVFEITFFAGTPGTANCVGNSDQALATRYGGLNAAAAALNYPGAAALQNAIVTYCGR